jgi:hypothetical protein
MVDTPPPYVKGEENLCEEVHGRAWYRNGGATHEYDSLCLGSGIAPERLGRLGLELAHEDRPTRRWVRLEELR